MSFGDCAYSCSACALPVHQLFPPQVKIKRSFPLTSVDSIVYSPETDPTTIELMFPTTVMTLISDSPEEARDWAQKITESESCHVTCPVMSCDLLCHVTCHIMSCMNITHCIHVRITVRMSITWNCTHFTWLYVCSLEQMAAASTNPRRWPNCCPGQSPPTHTSPPPRCQQLHRPFPWTRGHSHVRWWWHQRWWHASVSSWSCRQWQLTGRTPPPASSSIPPLNIRQLHSKPPTAQSHNWHGWTEKGQHAAGHGAERDLPTKEGRTAGSPNQESRGKKSCESVVWSCVCVLVLWMSYIHVVV